MSRRIVRFGTSAVCIAVAACLLSVVFGGCSRGPKVAGSVPGPAATGVRIDTEIVLTFDRTMDPATVQQAISLAPGPAEPAVTLSADGRQAVVRPNGPLAPDTQYTLTVETDARDTTGARLRSQFNLHFRTAPARQVACSSPVWSPDGTSIAWLEEDASDLALWVSGVTRTEERVAFSEPVKVLDELWPGSRAVFSPEGAILLAVLPQARGDTVVPGLVYVDLDGDGRQALALNEHLEDPSRLVTAFSPDGAWVAVQNDMYMADAHSDYFRQLGVARADGSDWSSFGNLLVGWGTDSSWLLYLDMPGIGEAHSFNYDVWRYEPATGSRTPVPGAPKINNFRAAARSPDGLFFVFGDWYAEDVLGPQGPRIERLPRDLWCLAADGTSVTRLTDGAGHNADPSISADGRVVFASDRDPAGDWDVWLLAGAQPDCVPVNLTARPGYDGQPVFSPDGTLIAYVSDGGGNREIWLMGTDGGERRMVSFR